MRYFILCLLACCALTLQAQVSSGKFGFFAGTTSSSFYRSSSLPITPFSANALTGLEAGIHLPLAKGDNYEAKIYLSYFQHGANEVFENSDGDEFDTKLSFQAVKLSLVPLYFKFGGPNFKVGAGLGGLAIYNLSYQFESNPELTTDFSDDLFSDFLYGAQGQIGIHYQNWVLSLTMYNGINELSSGNNGSNSIYPRGNTITLLYQFKQKEEASN